MLRFLFIVSFVLCLCPGVYAQLRGQARIDSMVKELPKQKEDTNKVKLLSSLSFNYSTINTSDGLKFGQQGLDLATKLGWGRGIVHAFLAIGINYETRFDYPKAIESYSKALAVSEKTGYKKGVAMMLGSIGAVYTRQSDYPKALAYHFRSLKVREEMGDKMGMADATGNIGNIYLAQKDYSKALEYYTRSLQLSEKIGSKLGITCMLNNIAVIYQRQKDYPNALEYYAKAIKLREEIGDRYNIPGSISNIGEVYAEQHNYTEAIAQFFKALKMAEELGDEYVISGCLGNISTSYLEIAKDAHKAGSAPTFSELQHKTYIPDGQIPQGRSALLHMSVEYIQRAITIQKKNGDLDGLQNSYKTLSTTDSMLGDYRGALEAYKLHAAIKDSVFNGEKKTEVMRLGMMRKMSVDSLKSAQERQVVELRFRQQRNYTYLGVAGMMLLIGFSFFIVKERGKSEKARKQSEGLLLNILPAEVANELKDRGATTAKHFDEVTVLFTDFVNFTGAGERMGTQKLVEELHNCFKAFDEIISKYNIEKIKTIGDAYLAVSGLPVPDSQHADNVMNAAMEIRSFMLQRKQKGHDTFEIRIGIHSGPVVAGIVGVKKFAYDIWGDTVNTAARMEQKSEAGKINISQTTYEIVKDKYNCTYRGEIEAKNKGMMKMYFVEG
jgi:adenylate cyclase